MTFFLLRPLLVPITYFLDWSQVICKRRNCYWEMISMGSCMPSQSWWVFWSVSFISLFFKFEHWILWRNLKRISFSILSGSPGVPVLLPYSATQGTSMWVIQNQILVNAVKHGIVFLVLLKKCFLSRFLYVEKEIFSLLGHWWFLFVDKYKIRTLRLNLRIFIDNRIRNTKKFIKTKYSR